METVSIGELRTHLREVLDRVENRRVPVVVTHGARKACVILSHEDYRSIEETAYLIRCPRNAKWLLDSLAEAKSGNVVSRELIEVD